MITIKEESFEEFFTRHNIKGCRLNSGFNYLPVEGKLLQHGDLTEQDELEFVFKHRFDSFDVDRTLAGKPYVIRKAIFTLEKHDDISLKMKFKEEYFELIV